jgi:FPC/CPF motif-containing protein YcgG
MSINLFEEIIDEGHKIAAKNMNDNIKLRSMGYDSSEWTNDNIGWLQTKDEGERMENVRSNG